MAFLIDFLLPYFRCSKFRICVFTSPVMLAPRLRRAFSWASRAASWRNSAASIFCVRAWLSMLATTAVAVRKGADPGAAWLAAFSMLLAACKVRSSAASLIFSVFKLSTASASSMSIIVRSAGLAAIGGSERTGKAREIVGLVISHSVLEADRIRQRGALQVNAENVLHEASVLADHLRYHGLRLVDQGHRPCRLLVEIADCRSHRIDRVQCRFDHAVDYVQHGLNCYHKAPLRLCRRRTDKRHGQYTCQRKS